MRFPAMKSSVGLLFPGLLFGLLCLQSVCGELSREQHQRDQPASVVRPQAAIKEDPGGRDPLVFNDRASEGDSLSSSERRRTDYDGFRQVRGKALKHVLPVKTNKHLLNSAGQVDGSGAKADFPCPDAAAIAPCVCSYDANYNIDLNCTFVESEEQLENVFQQEFPVKELRGFYMTTNDAVTVLSNILNGISFISVDLCCGNFALNEISEYFLLASKDSLAYLGIQNSQLSSDHFPFAVLAVMEKLQEIDIYGSSITWIPPILAPNIRDIYFSHIETEIIESGTFPIHAGSLTVFVEFSSVSTVEPGSFYWADANSISSNGGIHIVLQGNRIESLQAGTFLLRDGPMMVWLTNVRIASIAPGTFVMPPTTDFFTFTLSLYNNQMETFDEDVFGELMPFTEELLLGLNPLLCGCDIAWLVTNASYMLVVDDRAACADGTNLHDLDPALYEAVC